MSYLIELLCCLMILLCVSVLPVLPQECDQFDIQPPVGPGMPLVIPVGGSQTVTCRHNSPSRPPITLTWVRDVTSIREGTDDPLPECSCRIPSIESDPFAMVKELIFENFAAPSAAEYSCRTPNIIGSGMFNICRFDVLVAEAPSISDPQPSTSYTVTLGNTLTIPIVVAGVPTPTITWRNSSTELMDGGRVDISDTGSLTVTGVASYDRGNYSLNLTNIGGNLVRYFPVFVPFVEITSISEPRTENNQIRVTCTTVGYPNPTAEWRDSSGNVINTNIETSINPGTYETTFTVTLLVNKDVCQDQEEISYSCSARNRNDGAILTSTRRATISCNDPQISLPQPMNVEIFQNGRDSVTISWTITNSDIDFQIDICYTRDGGSRDCLSDNDGPQLPQTTMSTNITGLENDIEYTFTVFSVRDLNREGSAEKRVTLQPCSGVLSTPVYGVSVTTAVSDGERTFSISWRESQGVVMGYKVMETKTQREWMVRDRPNTNFITPADLCNGEDHSFVVMAIGYCLERSPPSFPAVIAKCESPGRIKITGVTTYDNAVNVSWALKQSASSYSIDPPLSITVLEIQLDSNGQQLQLNYSKSNPNEERYQCLGKLKPSTFYKVCLHPVYSDSLTEIVPVCIDVMTESSNNRDFDSSQCNPPEKMTVLGTAVEQTLIPDYAIAVIVIGGLILLAVVFCGIGVCFACSNNKSKDIDDIGSDYSSSIAPGMGMQGRVSSNHNRKMSPTRSCLSYHSKGHSTNWQDHMGTLREMDTEVGTNV